MARVMERVSTVNTNDHRRPASTKQRSGSGVGRFTILGSELPEVTGGEISHLRQTFLRRAESAGGERPQQQQPIQRPALGRGDSFKRRMTFVGGGGLGSSTRRLSLDDRELPIISCAYLGVSVFNTFLIRNFCLNNCLHTMPPRIHNILL